MQTPDLSPSVDPGTVGELIERLRISADFHEHGGVVEHQLADVPGMMREAAQALATLHQSLTAAEREAATLRAEVEQLRAALEPRPIETAPEGQLIEVMHENRDGSWWVGTGYAYHIDEPGRTEGDWVKIVHYNGNTFVSMFGATHWRPIFSRAALQHKEQGQ